MQFIYKWQRLIRYDTVLIFRQKTVKKVVFNVIAGMVLNAYILYFDTTAGQD